MRVAVHYSFVVSETIMLEIPVRKVRGSPGSKQYHYLGVTSLDFRLFETAEGEFLNNTVVKD
jgi:hypothetical protein